MKRNRIKKYGLLLAWFVSIIATCGSLYFSEIMLFEPCSLCWLQRICMYPLTVVLGYAALTEDRKYARPAIPLAIIGLGIAIYHYLGQKVASIGQIMRCKVGVPCNVDYIDWLGFITIPFLALTAFGLITIFLSLSFGKTTSETSKGDSSE